MSVYWAHPETGGWKPWSTLMVATSTSVGSVAGALVVVVGASVVVGESPGDAFVVVGVPLVVVGASASVVVVVVVGPESVLSPAHATVARTNAVIKAARRVIDPWQH